MCLLWIRYLSPNMCKNLVSMWTVDGFFPINRLSFFAICKRGYRFILCLAVLPWLSLQNKSHIFKNFDKLQLQFAGVATAGVKIISGNVVISPQCICSIQWTHPYTLIVKKKKIRPPLCPIITLHFHEWPVKLFPSPPFNPVHHWPQQTMWCKLGQSRRSKRRRRLWISHFSSRRKDRRLCGRKGEFCWHNDLI